MINLITEFDKLDFVVLYPEETGKENLERDMGAIVHVNDRNDILGREFGFLNQQFLDLFSLQENLISNQSSQHHSPVPISKRLSMQPQRFESPPERLTRTPQTLNATF